MKTLFYIISTVVISLGVLQNSTAQYVTIPDTNFRTYLQNNYPSCFNNTGQMDTACSGIVNTKTLSVINTRYTPNSSITDITGVKYFINLDTLYCGGNDLKNLPALPTSLTFLNCAENLFTNLPILPNSITNLNCNFNELISFLVLPTNLTVLECNGNQLNSLPTLPASLTYLDCGENQLTGLPALPSYLDTLYCYMNHIISLPSLPLSLITLDCHFNPIKCLPLLDDNLQSLNTGPGGSITCLPNIPTNPNFTSNLGTTLCTTPCDTGVTAILLPAQNNATISIFPNPSTGIVTMQGAQLTGGLARVINSNGKIVTEQNLSSTALDLSSFAKGLYVVQITSGQGVFTQKLVLE